MIRVGGRDWGTAAQLAARLGPDVTEDMVYRWRKRDGLTSIKAGRKVYSPYDETARIERDKSDETRGRPRRLDIPGLAA